MGQKTKEDYEFPTIHEQEEIGTFAMILERFPDEAEFGNWKKLCDALYIFYPGTGKPMQLVKEKLKQYFDIQKVKDADNKSVLKVKKKRTDVIKRHNGRKGEYSPLIQKLILELLLQEEDQIGTYTYNQLWFALGMQNNNNTDKKLIERWRIHNAEITDELVQDFNRRKWKEFKRLTETALKRLEEDLMICKVEYNVMIVKEKYKDPEKASRGEEKFILKVQFMVAKEMGYGGKDIDSIKQKLYQDRKSPLFYEKVKIKLNELKGWINYFDTITIKGNEEDILEDHIDFLEQKIILNNKMIEKMRKNTRQSWGSYLRKREKIGAEYDKIENGLLLGKMPQTRDSFIREKLNMGRMYDAYTEGYVDLEDEITDFFLNIKYTASNIVDYLDDVDAQKKKS